MTIQRSTGIIISNNQISGPLGSNSQDSISTIEYSTSAIEGVWIMISRTPSIKLLFVCDLCEYAKQYTVTNRQGINFSN
jgi:hypothetical protein